MKTTSLRAAVLTLGLAFSAAPSAFAVSAQLPPSMYQLRTMLDGLSSQNSVPVGPLTVPVAQGAPVQGKALPSQADRYEDVRVYEMSFRSVVMLEVKDGEERIGAGSGFIIDPAGLILTNNHVVNPPLTRRRSIFEAPEPAGPAKPVNKRIVVSLYGHDRTGRGVVKVDEYEATIVGSDKERDIAVLKIKPSAPLAAFKLQMDVKTGEHVWAIGAPFGLHESLSSGIISFIGRGTGGSIVPSLQTTAALNPGNSGGPLIVLKGKPGKEHVEVVGINEAIFSQVGENNGVGFVLPISNINGALQQILKTGKSTLGTIRIVFKETSAKNASGGYAGYGAQLSTVTAGGPADKAGLKADDVIVQLNGNWLGSQAELVEGIANALPGSKILLGVQRAGKTLKVEVTVEDARAPAAASNMCGCGCGLKRDCGCKHQCEAKDSCTCAP